MRRVRESVQWKCIKRTGRESLVMRYRLPNETTWREMSTGCKTLRDAEKWAAKRVRKIEDGEFDRTGWAAFKERYRKDHLSGLALKTQEAFTTASTVLERMCRFESIEEITGDLLVRFAGKLRAAGRSEATVDAYRSHILAALSWAASIKMIRAVPVLPRVRRARKGTQSRGRPLTREEIERMAMSLPATVGARQAKQWAWNLEAMNRSGMRLGETFELYWEPGDWHYIDRLDGHRPRLVISAASEKGFRDRILPITPDFAAMLRDVPKARRRGRVIKWTLSRGETNSVKTVSKRISAIGAAAKVIVGEKANGDPQFATAHDFRRTFALRWAPKVMPIVLKDLMRHSSLETTLRYYVGLNADRMGDALWSTGDSGDKLGDMLDSLFSVDHSESAGNAANHGIS